MSWEISFIVPDKANPRWGWICYRGEDGSVVPIAYVNLSNLGNIE